MWASNFGRTNLPSGIIYAFAMQEQANEEFDLLLKDDAGEGMTEDDRDNWVRNEVSFNYDNTIEWLEEILDGEDRLKSNYVKLDWKWIWEKRLLWYTSILLYNKESKNWEDASINIVVENWYHDGARFDIDLDDLYDNFPPLNKSQQKLIDKEVRRIEKAFAKVTYIKLKRVWGFSDGTSLYEKA